MKSAIADDHPLFHDALKRTLAGLFPAAELIKVDSAASLQTQLERTAGRAIVHGSSGYIPKPSSLEGMAQAISVVLASAESTHLAPDEVDIAQRFRDHYTRRT